MAIAVHTTIAIGDYENGDYYETEEEYDGVHGRLDNHRLTGGAGNARLASVPLPVKGLP